MNPQYISKAFKINSAGNFEAWVSPSLKLFMTRPEQGEWSPMTLPVHEGDGYHLKLVFSSVGDGHSMQGFFTASERTLNTLIAKLRDIEQIENWPAEWEIEQESSIHIAVVRHRYDDSIPRTEFLTLFWNTAGGKGRFGFRSSIVHEGVTSIPHFPLGRPTRDFCERISSIYFDRPLLNSLVSYFDSYKLIVKRRATLIERRSKCEEAFLLLLKKHFEHVTFTEQVPFENSFTRTVNYIDFAYEPRHLAIEIDGRQYHDPALIGNDSWEYQLRRDRAMKLLGWTVLRFTCREVFTMPDQVVHDIKRALGE